MSNHLALVRTKFVDLIDGNETFGYRLYDDYASTYCNTWKEPPPKDDLEFVKKVYDEGNEVVFDLINAMIEFGNALSVDGHFLNWDDLKESLTGEGV